MWGESVCGESAIPCCYRHGIPLRQSGNLGWRPPRSSAILCCYRGAPQLLETLWARSLGSAIERPRISDSFFRLCIRPAPMRHSDDHGYRGLQIRLVSRISNSPVIYQYPRTRRSTRRRRRVMFRTRRRVTDHQRREAARSLIRAPRDAAIPA